MLLFTAVDADRSPFEEFQWAPTLGGECYRGMGIHRRRIFDPFQWAPTLGGECYVSLVGMNNYIHTRFNGHPPLGVNATCGAFRFAHLLTEPVSMGTHPRG